MKRKFKRFIKNLSKKQKLLISIIAVFVISFTLIITFGRYIYNYYNNYILESKGFYFNSTVMSINGTKHSINNWDGVNPYPLTIDVNNKKNDLLWTESDITYDITVECSENIRCVLNKTTGIIRENDHADSYTITIYPNGNFSGTDKGVVTTKAKSTYPFVKELSTTYNIGVETSSFSYKITDSPGSKYLILELTNSFTYYKVVTAFGSYSVGDNISIDQYNALTEAQRKNCLSARVKLDFDPNDVLLDMTDLTYSNRIANSQTTEKINNYNYINGFGFIMEAASNTKIVFYKTDTTKDYTYPSNNNPIIDVDPYTVENIETGN